MTKSGFKQRTADSRARRRRGEPRFPLRRSRILSPQSGCSADARAVGSARGAGGAPDAAREARPLPPRPEEDGVASYPARRERAGQWHDRTTSGAQRRRPPVWTPPRRSGAPRRGVRPLASWGAEREGGPEPRRVCAFLPGVRQLQTPKPSRPGLEKTTFTCF